MENTLFQLQMIDQLKSLTYKIDKKFTISKIFMKRGSPLLLLVEAEDCFIQDLLINPSKFLTFTLNNKHITSSMHTKVNE